MGIQKLALLAGLSVAGVVMQAHAAQPSQFQEVGSDVQVKSGVVPRSLDSAPQTVVVIMRGDSVAAIQRDRGQALSRAEKDNVVRVRQAEHNAVLPEIRRRGGQVLGHFHSALNGIKVHIARDQIDALRLMPGVVDVKEVGTYERTNTQSIPYVGAPQVWQLPAQYQGQGVKIAIIDSGIDYTHANFGGPGTVSAFNAAKANSTGPADPALFGPLASKIKGGIDLVGDSYTGTQTPVPDSNPLDCGGHGSHVAGTAAGFGVNANGTTYTGPYSSSAYTPGAFKIGPGVAPKADLYAVRVFGCSGSTGVISEAIDWAVLNGMDVINMSLGSSFGSTDNVESVAVANAIAAGILVVVSSGNSGPIPYIGGSPASSDGVIAVAASDGRAGFYGATLALAGGNSITVQNSNGAAFSNATNYGIVVLRNANGTVSLGCNEAEYDKARNGGIDIVGKLVVTVRGDCARVFRAGAGQHYGAAAVAMINNASGYPSFEGVIIGGDPATNPYEPVTIPFFGVLQADQLKLTGPSNGSAPANTVATNISITNPGLGTAATFSSAGPRIGDSALRPGVTAPGVSTTSTLVGSGSGSVTNSGTSMAAPHVAGVSALVRQAKPTWSMADRRAAIVQTTAPGKLTDYSPRVEGSGLIQPLSAVNTEAVVRTPNDSISFGYADLLQDFSSSKQLILHNDGAKPVQFNISVKKVTGPASANVTAPAFVVVNAKSDAVFTVVLSVPAADVGGVRAPNGDCCQFQDIGGYIQLTPSSARLNGGVTLTVPYYLVAHSRSNLAADAATLPATGSTSLVISNANGALAAAPDFYALGQQALNPSGVAQADVRAIGVQSIPISATDRKLVFAINTFNRISTPLGYVEWDIYIDPTGAATSRSGAKYILFVTNGSNLSTDETVQNKLVVARYTVATGVKSILSFAEAGTDNSTVLVSVNASQLGLTASNPTFNYWEVHSGRNGSRALPGKGRFNAFNPSLTVSGGGMVAPNASVNATVSINGEWAVSPALGLMVVAGENPSGMSQALLIPAVTPAP